ncbi:MAG TPA: sigma-70 family RNA polymerase sigma factor [Terriglobales bacterium]|nr:sigma-70 family RNA polymerase sigma factor [Terriglobales bacterium]
MERATEPATGLPPEFETLVTELYAKSSAAQFGMSQSRLDVILAEVVRKYAGNADASEIRRFCACLRVEELVLARACAEGNEHAWEIFLTRYREKLYDIGLQIAREDSAARDLADSLYANLYGTELREGRRVSKLSSYTGRGSLEGWLRTVMAQEHVNRYRRNRRNLSLDEESEGGAQFAAPEPEPSVPADPRLVAATDAALGALPAEDRFILASYYLDGRTLAETARLLSVHESTISRKLDKLAKYLRKQILAALVRRGMSRGQAEEALAVDVRDLSLNVRDRLAQDSSTRTFPEKNVEAQAGDGPG